MEAAFMKNWSSTAGLKYDECPWLVDRQDALRVAAFLRIPMHTLDFEKQYEKKVLDYFFKEYQAGRTPNPDVMCNKEIKFKLLYNWAMKNGFDYLATGHYAQIHETRIMEHKSKNDGRTKLIYSLLRSKDEFKDQTYFIYNIKQGQLPHVLFPVGGMLKKDVRKLAQKIKLPNSDKKESMGLCFVGRIRLKDFLEQKLNRKPGPIVLTSPSPSLLRRGRNPVPPQNMRRLGGVVIGEHQGLHYYTIGQRQGIGVGNDGPYYVTKKDLKKNTLYVTNNPADPNLMVKEIKIHSVNWITNPWSMKHETRSTNKLHVLSFKLYGRFRHQGTLVPLVVNKIRKDHFQIKFSKPQKAIASGQSLVLYSGKTCLGGGVIA